MYSPSVVIYKKLSNWFYSDIIFLKFEQIASTATALASGNGKQDRLELKCLAEIESIPLHWLWENRIPLGKLTLLVGDPGLEKSLITLDIASRISTGARWPDDNGNAPLGNVIILSTEDDVADTIKPRLLAAGADCSRVFIIEAVRRIEGGNRSFCLM